MGLWVRIRHLWKAMLLLAVGAAGGAAALAVASIPDSTGVIHACYQTVAGGAPAAGVNLRIIDPSAAQSCNTAGTPGTPPEAALNWNQQGPQGIPGATGSPGATGATGPTGAPGAAATANTITLDLAPPLIKASTGPEDTVVLRRHGNVVLQFSFESFAFGGKGSIGSAHGIKINEVTLVRKYDKLTPTIVTKMLNGGGFATGTIFSKKVHGTQVRIDLTNVGLAGYSIGSGGGGVAVQTIILAFSAESSS